MVLDCINNMRVLRNDCCAIGEEDEAAWLGQ